MPSLDAASAAYNLVKAVTGCRHHRPDPDRPAPAGAHRQPLGDQPRHRQHERRRLRRTPLSRQRGRTRRVDEAATTRSPLELTDAPGRRGPRRAAPSDQPAILAAAPYAAALCTPPTSPTSCERLDRDERVALIRRPRHRLRPRDPRLSRRVRPRPGDRGARAGGHGRVAGPARDRRRGRDPGRPRRGRAGRDPGGPAAARAGGDRAGPGLPGMERRPADAARGGGGARNTGPSARPSTICAPSPTCRTSSTTSSWSTRASASSATCRSAASCAAGAPTPLRRDQATRSCAPSRPRPTRRRWRAPSAATPWSPPRWSTATAGCSA